MKNGICPKCNGNEIYRQPGSRLPNEKIVLTEGLLTTKATAPDKYICDACGYLEYYLSVPEDMKVIRENWEKL